jgi:hypothetical protein
MIWHDFKSYYLKCLFLCNFLNNGKQPFFNVANQNLSASFRTPDKMIV